MILPGQIQLVASPVFDLLASMFRLNVHDKLRGNKNNRNAEDLSLDNWVNQQLKTLPATVKEELEVFFNYESFIGLSLVRKSFKENNYETYPEFLNFLNELPASEMYHCFLQTGFIQKTVDNIANQLEVIEFIQSTNLPEVEKWKLTYLYMDLEKTKSRFISLVQKCWNLYFEDEVDEVSRKQEKMLKQLTDQYKLKDRTSLYAIFPHLDRDNAIPEETLIVSAPSVFYGLSSLTSFSEEEEDDLFFHLFGINQPEFHQKSAVSQSELMESFKTLADEKRIKMIQILSVTPSYGYELAQQLKLSNSTVSHHLSSLAALGIVKSKRKDSRVYYEVNKDRLKELMHAITATLVE